MIETWMPPQGTLSNDAFSVFVRDSDSDKYEKLFTYNVRVGHQDDSWNDSSMVIFDFDDTVHVRVEYHKESILEYDLRPHAYNIESKQINDYVLEFSIAQDEESPRKIVLSINGDYESKCLHILTNPCEKEKPDPFAPNVLYIAEGDPIPLVLPEGKDTYYFAKGTHRLPQGLWAEIDLGKAYAVNRFKIITQPFSLSDCNTGAVEDIPQRFLIEGKLNVEDEYKPVYDGRDNLQTNEIEVIVDPVEVRYLRVLFLGMNSDKGWRFSNLIRQFKAYDAVTGKNVALNSACDGAIKQYSFLTDDSAETYSTPSRSANWHSAESFFLCRDGYSVYLEQGCVVKGSILADGMEKIRIFGRGILDCSEIEHKNPGTGEARTGAIWFTGCRNCSIEGITVIDAPMWQIVLNYSEDVQVKNINLLGYVVNADGIHVSGCTNAEVSGVFVRSCDDLIVAYHYGKTENIVVKNSVFCNDNAHVFLFGLGETPNAPIQNCRLINCYVVSQLEAPWQPPRFSGVVKLWAHGGNYIQNILVKDLHIDPFIYPGKGCVFQMKTENRFKGEKSGLYIRDVKFENIYYYGADDSPSLISGLLTTKDCEYIVLSEKQPQNVIDEPYVEDISFKNYFRNGTLSTNFDEANIELSGNIRNIIFK